MDLDWVDFTEGAAVVGFSSLTDNYFRYFKIGYMVVCEFGFDGVSNSTALTCTLPFANTEVHDSMNGRVTNNGAEVTTSSGRISFGTSSATLTMYRNSAANTWTASGSKIFYGQFFYFTN